MKYYLALGAIVASLAACQASLPPQQPLMPFNAQAPSTPSMRVYFSNAYKGLFEDNEKIGRADPQNIDKGYLRMIAGAKSTLDCAFYDIDNPQAVDALIDAHKRGVRVRFVTDSDNAVEDGSSAHESEAIARMKEAGIGIVLDDRSGLMHHKFIVADGQAVWMGSMNLTTSSIYHHNNSAFSIKSPELAANFQNEFNRMFDEKNFSGPRGPVPNPVVTIDGMQIRTLFSPRGGMQEAVLQQMKEATQRISLMTFSLTDPVIGQLLEAKKSTGIKISGVYDFCMAGNPYSLFRGQIKRKNGYDVYWDGNQALLHHKTILVDSQTIISGSFNFSDSGEASNNESILIIENAPKIGKVFYAEYQRLRTAALNNKGLPPYEHPACGYKPSPTPPPNPASLNPVADPVPTPQASSSANGNNPLVPSFLRLL